MTRRLFAVCTALTLVLSVNQLIRAQGMGGSSAFGSSGMGSSGFGSSSFGSSGFGSSGFGSSGFGSSGFGSSGFGSGSSGFGSSGFGSSGFGSNQFGGSGSGSSGFGGKGFGGSGGYGNQLGGAAFVGRDATDMQNTFGQTSHAMNQVLGQMNRNMRQSSRKQTSKTVQNPPQPMRVAVHAAFTPPQQSSAQLAESIRARLTKILADHHMSPAGLTIQGDTAVVTGTAASEDERAVIGQLISLQPGVGDVRNEMTVSATSSGTIVPTPGS